MAAPQKYAHIDFTPPAGARREAEQGLKLRREHGRGGTAVGVARARDIANGVKLSPSTVRRMKAFFDRHASDSKAEGFRRGEKGWPSNGVIANKLWGGPAGYSWAKKVVAQMEAADARSTYSLDAETSTIESGTDKRSTVIPNVERRFLGNFSEAEASDPDLLKVEERADPETGKKRTYLVGYAARFGKNSLLLGDFVERIAPSAFEIVEKRQDAEGKPLETRCLFNHSPDNLLGRFPTTMRMWVDERGLRYECLLPETRRDIAELVARGDLKGSSFSFVVAEGGEKWTTEEGRSTRLVTRIKSLLDCGPVTYPAYDSATVAVAKRSYDQFVAGKSPTPVVEKRDSGIAARAAEEARKTQEFLAERRKFCPTGEGGGIDNSCGGEGGVGSSKDSPKKDSGRKVSSAVKGALAGAAAGALGGGLPGAVIGAVALGFAAYVASGKKTDEALEKAKSDMGIDDNKLNIATAAVFGKGKPQDIKTKVTEDGVVAMYGREGQVFISSKPPWFGIKGKSNLHFNPNGGGEEVAKDAELAAKSVGVQTVTVQSWTDDSDKALKAAGFKPTGVSDSEDHDLWIKDLSKKGSKRDIEELHAFLAERRAFCATGPGGGVDNSCGSKGGDPVGKVVDELKNVKDALDRYNSGQKTTFEKVLGGYGKGVLAGGLAGTVIGGGGGGFLVGSLTGGLVGAAVSALKAVSSSVMKSRMDGLKEKMKLSDDSLKKAGDKLFTSSQKTHIAAIDKKTIAIEQGDSIALISDGSPFSKDSKGTSFHYQPGSDKNGKFDLKAVEGAARAVKAKTVSVEAWHDSDVKLLESKGYRQVAKSEYSSSKGIYEKSVKRSKRDIQELHDFLAERRGFCPTGEGGGIDNSCNAGGGGKGEGGGKAPGGGGSTGPKGSGGEKYKKSDDEDTDWLGRKTDKGPNWLGNDPKKTMQKIADSGGKVDGQLAGFKVHPKMGYDSGKPKGDYKEWEKGKDHLDKSKEKDAQDFLDKARADQLARGGKDGGKSDDGGGVQTWSKGEHFPWTTKQVGTDEGHVQGLHPDGSTTKKYPFKGDSSEAHKKVYEEIKSKKKDKRSVTLSEMTEFLMERAG